MPRCGDVECSKTLGAAAAAGWAYLAEGGAHLVLERRDVADDDPNVAGRVLRLRKTKTGTSWPGEDAARDGARGGALEPSSNACTDAFLWASHPGFQDTDSADDLSWAFAHHVMRPLLGGRFVDPGAFAPVDREFLRAVADAVEPARPRARRARSGVDLCAARAALVPDARRVDRVRVDADRRDGGASAAEDWFCVEVKPKCGFALVGDPEGASRFAMHQALRVRRGEVRRASAYDPRDLFAGCDARDADRETRDEARLSARARRRAALRALAEAPRNNLRVHRRGRRWPRNGLPAGPSQSDDASSSDDARRDASTASTRARGMDESLDAFVAETDGDAAARVGDAARLLDLVEDALAVSGVLAPLLRAQRRDTIGVEAAARLWRSLSSYATRPSPSALDAAVAEAQRETLRDFVIAAVAKDCSVLVAFRGARGGDVDDGGDGTFAVASAAADGGPTLQYRCRVSVVDVDLKSIANMPKWLETHREIARNWARRSSAANDAC